MRSLTESLLGGEVVDDPSSDTRITVPFVDDPKPADEGFRSDGDYIGVDNDAAP
ncbi:hypothetical protein V7S43_007307 [Phytophthora oleae]|uniref:Uncharacterized protein n=1 Tax=Phytophthora oleae TaxID=2107226 RepID=A0ABD3FN54_9STRA